MFRQDRHFSLKSGVTDISTGGGSIIFIEQSLNPLKIDAFVASDSVAIILFILVKQIISKTNN